MKKCEGCAYFFRYTIQKQMGIAYTPEEHHYCEKLDLKWNPTGPVVKDCEAFQPKTGDVLVVRSEGAVKQIVDALQQPQSPIKGPSRKKSKKKVGRATKRQPRRK